MISHLKVNDRVKVRFSDSDEIFIGTVNRFWPIPNKFGHTTPTVDIVFSYTGLDWQYTYDWKGRNIHKSHYSNMGVVNVMLNDIETIEVIDEVEYALLQ